jgi:hypothetical protein
MIMGSKQGLGAKPGIVMDILSNSPSDRQPVIGAGAPPNLIKDD